MFPSRLRQFLALESASGIVLFFAALLAFICANSPYSTGYQAFFQTEALWGKPLLFWINEGVMTLFFLLIGLELKREFIEGELSSFSTIALPAIAALGGMLIPAFIYIGINFNHPLTLKGWAVPVATDIAFALGVLSLFGKRIPHGLKIFLMALAIFDDIGAIIIIALFYSRDLSYFYLASAGCLLLILYLLNCLKIDRLSLYFLLGVALWFCILKSGVHATVTGVLLAFLLPASSLEKILHPWVAYLVIPLFAFSNAGLSLHGLSLLDLLDPVVLGTIAGLCIGKQVGVSVFSWLIIRLGWAKLPAQTTWLELYGVALLCGIGFTMSLFLGTLAFQNNEPLYLTKIQLGVLLGSVISGVLGAIVLQVAFLKRRRPA